MSNGYVVRSAYTERMLRVMAACRDAGVPVMLWGPPGTGKTALIEALAAAEPERPRHLVKLIGSTMEPTDVAGQPHLSEHEEYGLVQQNALPIWARELLDAERSILFLDELGDTPPSVQSAELTILQSREVCGRKLPPGCWIVAAANPTSSSADGWGLAAPLNNRICHLEWDPPVADWLTGMMDAWGADPGAAELAERAKVVAFLRDYGNLLQQPAEIASDSSGAWASRRSWDNATRALAQLEDASVAAGRGEAAGEVRAALLVGLVGEEAARQYLVWSEGFRLPDPDEVMDSPDSVDWEHTEDSQVFAILASVISSGCPRRYADAVKVFISAGSNGAEDIGAALVPELVREHRRPPGQKFPVELMGAYGDTVRAAGLV